GAALAVDPLRLAAGVDVAAAALDWALLRLAQGPVLVYATAEPEAVRAVQAQLGAQRAGELVEGTLARVAAGLVQAGVGQLLVAGGETSGACVQALGITQLRIGPQIDPGVPWCHAALPAGGLHLALKSGNFGGPDFFTRAFQRL
ncbi:MAG: nucleotide-binding domain containing protein, partial [Rubrivivax sp.]|nr:nucleotide-binding domain containing protein [Rubrivivax sp.]